MKQTRKRQSPSKPEPKTTRLPPSVFDKAASAAAHRHLRKSHPRMAELIARARHFEVSSGGKIKPFEALAESIAYQQLNGKAAATIWGRVMALYGKKSLDPKAVLATPDEKLRGAGLSGSKVAALKDLA